MTNEVSSARSIVLWVSVLMRAKGGCSRARRVANSSRCDEVPCTSTVTPSGVLHTWPASPISVASRYTKGLNPTPCTVPPICTRHRSKMPMGRAL